MSAVEDQIRHAGSRNAELLAILAQTDYAPSALQQQNSYIKEVEQTVAQNNATLKKLATQREKEGEDHKKVRSRSRMPLHFHVEIRSPEAKSLCGLKRALTRLVSVQANS